jgi:hypothetical protein
MWRSLAIGVVLAGVLAGCAFSGSAASNGTTARPLGSESVGESNGSTERQALVVGCDQVVGREASPTAEGYRKVLTVISVPPAYIHRSFASMVKDGRTGRRRASPYGQTERR